MSELSFVTIDCGNDLAKILYLNPMRDSNGQYKSVSEWVRGVIDIHFKYWYIANNESMAEGLAWMYNSIFDSIHKAQALCEYLYDNVIKDQDLLNLFYDLGEIIDNDFPKLIKDLVN